MMTKLSWIGLSSTFVGLSCGFTPPMKPITVTTRLDLRIHSQGKSEETICWNEPLRLTMGAISTLGALETAYITSAKLSESQVSLCTEGCTSVLNGPLSVLPGTNVPLSAIGLCAYFVVAILAAGPVLTKTVDEDSNRVLLASISTAMGVFSLFLAGFLFVTQQWCTYCAVSAGLSMSLALLTWLGGVAPSNHHEKAVKWSVASGMASLLAASVLFSASVPNGMASEPLTFSSSSATLAVEGGEKPPPITTTSTSRSLRLAADLNALDARFFGAFWCSHCYDQKQALGRKAMEQIPYIECSRDGFQSQAILCKERKVPGYPTWEIGGELFPGEREVAELEEIVAKKLR